MANPKRQADRTRASALRKKLDAGGVVTEAQAEFLKNYEAARNHDNPSPIAAPPVVLARAVEEGTDVGASEEGRTVKFELKENKKAIGTGDAATVAAGTAMMSKAHADAISAVASSSRAALDILKEAVEVYKSIALDQREAMRDILQAQIDERAMYREAFLKSVQLEAKLVSLAKERGDDDPVGQLLREVAGHYSQELFGGKGTEGAKAPNGAAKPAR